MSESTKRESAASGYAQQREPAESLEDRQWRLKVEEARTRVAEEEAEWRNLLSRANSALSYEEREWERLRARAELKSSGAFLAAKDDAPAVSKPPPLRVKR